MAKFESLPGVGKKSGYTIPHEMLRFDSKDDFRDRTTDRYREHLENLKRSILENGIEEPISGYRVVEPDGNELIFATNGRTRYQAVSELIAEGKLKPEDIRYSLNLEDSRSSAIDHLFRQFRANNSLNFEPVEEANLFRRAVSLLNMDEDDAIAEISKNTGYSIAQVRLRLDLAYTPKQVQELVADGSLGITTAVNTVKELTTAHGDQTQAIEVLTEAVEEAKKQGKKKATQGQVTNTINERRNRDRGKNREDIARRNQEDPATLAAILNRVDWNDLPEEIIVKTYNKVKKFI